MWRRPVVTILMLIIAVILTLPMRAQQKIVAPGVSPAQADVAAGFSHGTPTVRSPAALAQPTLFGPTLRCRRKGAATRKPGKALHPGAGRKHGARRIRRRVGREADRAARD